MGAESAETSTSSSSSTNSFKPNCNGPDHRYQLNQDLLYEREFGGHTFVSAHLQRLQHGCFTDENVHKKDTPHVTFVAITFTFHPSYSEKHRFTSAVITLTAKSQTGQAIRFLKFAPHLAYGRISSASLKWNFKLGATVGLSQGPGRAALEPAVGYENDRVVGSMMKIQGSTRFTSAKDNGSATSNFCKTHTLLPDTKLIWSLEENGQQESGLPREFTFVFLMERLRPDRHLSNSSSITVTPSRLGRSKSHTMTSVSSESTLVATHQDVPTATTSLAPPPIDEEKPHRRITAMFLGKTVKEAGSAIPRPGHLPGPSHSVETGVGSLCRTHSQGFSRKGKEKGRYSDIGTSELTLELLDKGKQTRQHTFDGAGDEPTQYPALDIRSLPHEVLPGSDRTSFTMAQNNASSIRTQSSGYPALDIGSLPHEVLPGSDRTTFTSSQTSVSESTTLHIETVEHESLSSSTDLTTLHDTREGLEKFPDLNPDLIPPGMDELDGAGDILHNLQHETKVVLNNGIDYIAAILDNDYEAIFTPIRMNIDVQPRISGCLDNKISGEFIGGAMLTGEIGQKFPTVLPDYNVFEDMHDKCMLNGLYNFAKLPGSFEDMVELPGTAVTSVEPTLS